MLEKELNKGNFGGNRNKNNCHSRMPLSGISAAFNSTQGEDFRLQASGMTLNVDVGQALPDNRKYLVEDDSYVVGPEQKLLRTSALLNNTPSSVPTGHLPPGGGKKFIVM